MYDFAIVVLLGLAAYKAVDFLMSLIKSSDSTFRLVATLGMGVVFAELLDYSVFAAWGTSLREAWMGPVFTGLMIGSTSYLWHEVLGYIAGRRSREAEIEGRTPRAA